MGGPAREPLGGGQQCQLVAQAVEQQGGQPREVRPQQLAGLEQAEVAQGEGPQGVREVLERHPLERDELPGRRGGEGARGTCGMSGRRQTARCTRCSGAELGDGIFWGRETSKSHSEGNEQIACFFCFVG